MRAGPRRQQPCRVLSPAEACDLSRALLHRGVPSRCPNGGSGSYATATATATTTMVGGKPDDMTTTVKGRGNGVVLSGCFVRRT
ncbi:hypothetical protein PR202_gb07983 [Eleusine coracana subsp. coracana]|uniref:Uncharacterized protein n=1 Tax=Eleusine coracana subsp. coracana TaxID=191504 RepID=A0AAV5EBV5_ELECO|nr:hypothetical protein PR202_gb07983 [Eleusine coracana subsp. coracana]